MPFFTSPTSFHNANYLPPLSGLKMPMMAGASPQFDLLQAQSKMANPPPLHSSHPALPRLTMLVFEAVLEVVCVSAPGYFVARQGMFTAEMQKFTANLNVAVFTPCLSMFLTPSATNLADQSPVFTKLASQLTTDKLADLAIIPLIFLVQTLVSFLCSALISKAFGFSKRPRNFVIAMGVSN